MNASETKERDFAVVVVVFNNAMPLYLTDSRHFAYQTNSPPSTTLNGALGFS